MPPNTCKPEQLYNITQIFIVILSRNLASFYLHESVSPLSLDKFHKALFNFFSSFYFLSIFQPLERHWRQNYKYWRKEIVHVLIKNIGLQYIYLMLGILLFTP